MAVTRKSMELFAFGVLGAWSTQRAVAWLHEPPAARDRTTVISSPGFPPQSHRNL